MIEQFSPFTRKVLAVGMLILAIFGLIGLVISPTLSLLSTSLSELADARFGLARVEALRNQPVAEPGNPVPPGLLIKAPNGDAAAEQAMATVNAIVARTQVQVTGLSVLPPAQNGNGQNGNGQIALAIAVKGDHDAVLAFVNDIERAEPMLRFRGWSVTADTAPATGQPAGLILDGVLIAGWSKGQ